MLFWSPSQNQTRVLVIRASGEPSCCYTIKFYSYETYKALAYEENDKE